MSLSEPKSASMFFMSVILNKYTEIFAWFSLRGTISTYNPWGIPYDQSSSIYAPQLSSSLRRFINLYPLAVINGVKAAWFGWKNKITAIYGDLSYESILSSRVASIILNVPLLSSIHDDPINRLELKNYPKWIIKSYDKSLNKTLKMSKKIAVISDYMGEYYKMKYNVSTKTIFIGANVNSGVSQQGYKEKEKSKVFTIGSIGSIHCKYNWEKLAQSVKQLNNRSNHCKYKILHIGKLPKSIKDKSFITDTGYIGEEQLPFYLQKMDIGFLNWSFSSKYNVTARTSFPLKIHSYLSENIPLMALGPEGSSIVRFVNDNNCGISCTNNTVGDLREKIKLISTNKKIFNKYKNESVKLSNKYSRQSFFKEFESFIKMN
ncbi:MAG: hypothetical protein HOO10_11065 [Candidatus Marinimicrobia bacterium]|jgi:hypothetical protein|nr:hypothetical protein [Candidatus Neomarinimicrobiota bacterium]